jgi:hypothetical protein
MSLVEFCNVSSGPGMRASFCKTEKSVAMPYYGSAEVLGAREEDISVRIITLTPFRSLPDYIPF